MTMNTPIDVFADSLTGWLRMQVVGFAEDGSCLVSSSPSREPVACDLLQTSDLTVLRLAEGDEVMVWLPPTPGQRGVVMGRVGPSTATNAGGCPDHLVFGANKSLTLQCGEGSITLRGDGKVLIKGKELVSRADGINRVKGAAVAIN